jgi:hypothetical protein
MSDLGRVREKLQQIRAFESYEVNWSKISYALNEPLARDLLEKIEEEQGVELPDDYRRFLLEVGNGGAGPGYGLYSLEEALEERGDGIYSLADSFVAPKNHHHNVDVRAPGLLLIESHGCAFYSGLVLSGRDRGTVWSYVENAPGWIPECAPGYVDATGAAFEMQGSEGEHYAAMYDALLLEANRPRRRTFLGHYEAWLDGIIRAAAN